MTYVAIVAWTDSNRLAKFQDYTTEAEASRLPTLSWATRPSTKELSDEMRHPQRSFTSPAFGRCR